MKTPHLLAVSEGPEIFRLLVEGAGVAGLRIGWLDLTVENPSMPALEAAAGLGVARAAAVGPEATVAVKRRRGPAVLHDVLREHFLGCHLVLVRGTCAGEAPPTLEEVGVEGAEGGWRVSRGGAAGRSYSTAALIAALRRPHPWPTTPADTSSEL